MAFQSFPDTLYLKTMATGETVAAGGFSVPDAQELRHVVLTVYKHGTAGGTERLRLKVFHDEAQTKTYATSDWATVSEAIEGATYWIGRVRFDFGYQNLSAGETYYLGVESDGYTRSGDTFYIAFPLDWPLAINEQQSASAGLAFEIYGRREVTY